MADVKISALPSATTPLAGTELVPVVQAGITTQTTVTDIVAKAPVQSVAGKTGAVTLTPSDVGAEPADATILKSASIGVTVQGYNANTVVDASYVHTDNNYTTAEKSKLAGIADGAEVNINADWNAVSGDAQILNKPSFATVATTGAYADLTGKPTLGTAAATASTDYATAAQGTLADSAVQPAAIANMLETADIGVTVQGYSSVLANTTASFTTADETKLDGIAAGAEVNVNADWNAVSGDAQILNKPSFATVATTGAYADLTGKPTLGTAAATASTDYATAAQGALADSAVQPAAIANMLETSDIGVTVQGYSSVLANTTASFTTADEAKLDGIQAGAEVNVNADWNAVSGDAQILNKPTLGTAAAANTTDFATAAQGTKADSALQPAAIGVSVQAYDADLTSWAAITPSTKQDTLVSGTNIKTINGSSLLGSGNLTISGGGALAVSDEGTSLTTGATSFNFVGSGVTATASGTDITVTIPGGGGTGGVPAGGTTGQVLAKASATDFDTTWVAQSGGLTVNVQDFTSTGTSTWTKPAGVNFVRVILIGAGGGGGSGGRYATTSGRSGGAGGASGSTTIFNFRASDLGATESVTVGAGGVGGASVTTDTTAGNAGTSGGNTTFSYLFARGSGGGGGGNTSSGAAGGGSTASTADTIPHQNSPSGQNASGSNGATSSGSPLPGGAGAGSPANVTVTTTGGASILGIDLLSSNASVVTASSFASVAGGTDGGNGQDATSTQVLGDRVRGAGGGGGSYKTGQATGRGGNATVGGGGGGGAASDNGFASGAGGNGGDGWARIISW